jgi:hypothetical protein
MHKTKTMTETELGSEIQTLCDLRATAIAPGSRYGAGYETVQQRASAMLSYVVNEGRLFALKPSEWSMLLVGVTFCGFIALFF